MNETDAGGRPTLIETTMGDMALGYDGPVQTFEQWTPASGGGAVGAVAYEVGEAMLLDAETAFLGTSRRIEYGYDSDRLLVRAGSGSLPCVHLAYTFGAVPATMGTTLTARVGGASAAAIDPIATTRLDGLGELTSMRSDDRRGRVYEETICSRDEHGRVTARAEVWRTTSGSSTARQHGYGYDDRGFLTRYSTRDRPAAASPCAAIGNIERTGTSITYAYDDAGNRTDLTVNADDQVTTGGRTYDALGQLETRPTPSGGVQTFGYDTFGQLRTTSRAIGGATVRTDYDYDPAGRLTGIRPSSPGAVTPLPQRFVYHDDLDPIAWSRPARGTCTGAPPVDGHLDTLFFVYASRPHTPDLAYVDRCSDGSIDQTLRYATDERGSVRVVSDVATGTVEQTIGYDAWGLPTFGAGTEHLQPFGFIGGIWDGETRLWRLGAREYDPEIGRWTSKDPIGFEGGTNLYGYCDQDPVNCVDVTGLEWYNDGLQFFNALDRLGVVNFAAGFGDSLSLGLTRGFRSATGVTGVDYCSGAYAAGEWTEIGVELALTGGGAALRGLLSRASARRAARAAANRAVARSGLRGGGRPVHHINTIIGHPGLRGRSLFPLGGLPASFHSGLWNLRSMTAGAHAAAHRSARAAERLVAAVLTNPPLTGLRAARNYWWD